MFIVTNRVIHTERKGFAMFGNQPNVKGPLELRMAECRRRGSGWQLKLLPDKPTPAMRREVGLEEGTTHYASAYVARKILTRVRDQQRHLLFYVHGYNNNVKVVLDRAAALERDFNVEVLAFTWPAHGGGVRGYANYLSDKRDARASAGAFDRCLERIDTLLHAFHDERVATIHQRAHRRFADNAEARDSYIAREIEKGCPFSVNMLLHSMGNYLYKNTLTSSVYHGELLLFDNVIMAAADTNNEGHAEWVDRINVRNRLYVTINESDGALYLSRMKLGQAQKARLGHYPYNLNARQAVYVDFTGALGVGRSHGYFGDESLNNPAVERFFQHAFHGRAAEDDLAYDIARNLYRIGNV